MRVIRIVDGTSVDGPGLRTSIYVAGCDHRCPGCHNPSTWPMDAGEEMSVDALMEQIDEIGYDVTLTGGDPMYQPQETTELARRIKTSGKTVWLYTGYTYEEILADPRLAPTLNHIDVLVDGPFIQALRDTDLLFRGSSNQRLIHIPSSSPSDIHLWQPEF